MPRPVNEGDMTPYQVRRAADRDSREDMIDRERMTATIIIRCTPAAKAAIERAASRAGTGASTWMRNLALVAAG